MDIEKIMKEEEQLFDPKTTQKERANLNYKRVKRNLKGDGILYAFLFILIFYVIVFVFF